MILILWSFLMVLLAIVLPLTLIYCSLKVITFSASTLEVSWIILCVIVANYAYFHWWGA
jgi:hypothetical protein